MKLTLTAAAIAATLAIATPAQAFNGSGLEFYNTCGTPWRSGIMNPSICHGEVIGMADGLSSTRLLCLPPGISTSGMMAAVQAYMRAHTAQLGIPANDMLRNALLTYWGCRR
jgi:hypothetical protein